MSGTTTQTEMHAALFKRFTLWMAVGNAGGLIAVGAKLPDSLASPTAYLLLPSAWAFALGLVAAGVFNFFFIQAINPGEETNFREWQAATTVISGGASLFLFLFGLFYPLTVVSARYVGSGSLVG